MSKLPYTSWPMETGKVCLSYCNTKAGKLMFIPNDDTLNNPFCRLKKLIVKTFELNKPTNGNLVKVPKVVKLTNKKTL